MPRSEPDPSASTPRIRSLELLLVSLPFSAERRVTGEESIDAYNASSQAFTRMESLMVRVIDDDGRAGWGEAFGHRSNPATWAALEEIVGPFALGRSTEPAEFRAEADYAFHAFGRTGPVHFAVSAVDTALWDLAAQRSGMPLHRLLAAELGAEAATAIDCYASLVHYGEDPVEVAHHISRAQQAGFGAFKLHECTVEAVRAARQQAGPQADLMTDVNCHWDEAGADQALRDLTPYDLLWLEEPIFPPDDSAALARLAETHGRVAAGENASGTEGMILQIRSGAVRYAQPSVGKIGGVSGMLEVIAAARDAGVAVAPHCFYYGPALNASAAVVAALAGIASSTSADAYVPQLEVPFLNWPQTLHPLHGAGPQVTLPETPGLGFTPDQAVLEENCLRRSRLD